MVPGDKESRRDLSIAKDEYRRGDRVRPPHDPSVVTRRKRKGSDINSSNTSKFFQETYLDMDLVLESKETDNTKSGS